MSPPNPWLPTSGCTPDCLPRSSSRTRRERAVRTVRITVRGAAVVTVMLLGAVAALPAPLLGHDALSTLQRRWALCLLAVAGVRLRVLRSEATAPGSRPSPSRGTVVVANHVSWIDVLALYAVAPVRMLAKREVAGWPLLGTMAARAGTVFLERERLRELPAAVATLASVVRDGGAVGVFPEGTTRCGRALGTFRPAAFQAAIDGGVPVVPVAVRYDDGAAAFVGEDTLVSSLGRILGGSGIELTLEVLAPLESAAPADTSRAAATARRRELARRCERVIATSLALAAPDPAVEPVSLPAREEEVLDRVA